MPPSAFNHTTTLLSFEKKDNSEPKMVASAATGDFKSRIDSPAVDGLSRQVFFSGKVDERDLCIIDSDN